MARRVHVTISGRVQNVGFRAFAQAQAQRLGIAGWVRNLPDSRRVELEAEGEDPALEAFLHAIRAGPAGARVQSMQVEDQPAQSASTNAFVIR